MHGYSRRVLWLTVAASNNNPKIIANYYVNAVKEIGGTPLNLITDLGTENATMAGIHMVLTDSESTHKYVQSVRNQRIEAFWSIFKKNYAQWWMEYFAYLMHSGQYNPDVDIQKNCMQFCMMGVIQRELDEFRLDWNHHVIRPSRQAPCPSGPPDVLYFLSAND